MKTKNNIEFVSDVVRLLESQQIKAYLFGGWAEEVHKLVKPREHSDVDLMIIDTNFSKIDVFLSKNNEIEEVIGKRFSHKRAFEYKGMLCEIFLAQEDQSGYFSHFFDTMNLYWPKHFVQDEKIEYNGYSFSLATTETLQHYRRNNHIIEKLRKDILKK